MPRLKNTGHGQFFRQNHISQFVDRFFFFFALGVLQFLNAVENLTEIPWRIDRYLVANAHLQFSRELDPKHGRFAVQVELAVFDEFSKRNHFLLLLGIDAAYEGCEPPALKFNDHRALNVRCSRNDARCIVDLCFERSPIAQHVLRAHENVRVEIDHFLT